jgi:hypothetical protein
MKTKGLILALVAVVFAVGSAFTSKNAAMTNNVRIWLKQTSTSSFVCTAIPKECSQVPTGALCEVTIKKSDGNNEVVKAYSLTDEPACTVQMRHIEGQASVGLYDAAAEEGTRPFDVANLPNGQ